MSDLFQVNLLSSSDIDDVLDDKPAEEKQEETPAPAKDKTEPEKPKGEEKAQEKQEPIAPIVEIEGEEEEELEEVVENKKPSKKDLTNSVNYKALAEYYIDNGDWIKPDNWEDIKDEVEWDGKLFANFQQQQFEAKVKAAIEEEKSQYSPDYQQLLEHAKAGGNIQDLLPNYQQQVEIAELDPTKEDDAENIIKIECEAKGWSKKRIETYIESLKDRSLEDFSEVAKEAKDSIVKQLEEERLEMIEQQKAHQEQQRIAKESTIKKVREAIHNFKDPDREKKDIEEFWLKPKYQSGDKKFTEFEKISHEINSDPVKFAKFVKILKNFDKYTAEDPATTAKTKADVFNFLLSGQKDLGKNNNQTPETEKKSRTKGIYNPFQISSGV